MTIHTPVLMYATFQVCRSGGLKAGPALDALRTILQRVEQTGALELDEPDHHDDHDDEHDDAVATALSWFRTAMPGSVTSSKLPRWTPDRDLDPSDQVALTVRNQDLFHLIAVGVDDLRRLCAQGATLAVRDLGYAFHNLPGAADLHLSGEETTRLDDVSAPATADYPYGGPGLGQRSRTL